MKKLIQVYSSICCMVLFIAFASCNSETRDNNTQTNEDPKKEAEEHNEAKFDNPESKDAQFLVDAASINFMEIQLGNMASSKAVTTDVKELGKMLAEAHSKANDNLAELAKRKGISIPTALHEEVVKQNNSMNDATGIDFDKKYCDKMVEGHKEAIDKFENAAKESADADIQNWANEMLPTLRSHLDRAMNCDKAVKDMKNKQASK